MMKRTLAALAIAIGAASAVWACLPYVPQEAAYTPTVWPYTPPALGTGEPAAVAQEHADIPSNFDRSKWIVKPYGPTKHPIEWKFRTHCNFSHVNKDDPIVWPNQPGASHTHMYFGNTKADANSTYESLRRSGDSTCGGGPLNRSAYWIPAIIKKDALGAGRDGVVKIDYAIVYYEADGRTAQNLTRFLRGFNMVFGFNPNDPTDAKVKAEVAAANALPGPNNARTFKSYEVMQNGFSGWFCEASNGSNVNSPKPGSNLQPWLVNADGTTTLTCPTTQRMGVHIEAPGCWDGVNLTSPDGRSHVRYKIRERNSVRFVCPIGWRELPIFKLNIYISHTGPEDYGKWFLASDQMKMPDGTVHNFLPGQSMHADWIGAWDYEVMKTWMAKCTGVTIDGVPGAGNSCIDTQFGDGTAGKVQGHLNLGIRYATKPDAERFVPLQ